VHATCSYAGRDLCRLLTNGRDGASAPSFCLRIHQRQHEWWSVDGPCGSLRRCPPGLICAEAACSCQMGWESASDRAPCPLRSQPRILPSLPHTHPSTFMCPSKEDKALEGWCSAAGKTAAWRYILRDAQLLATLNTHCISRSVSPRIR